MKVLIPRIAILRRKQNRRATKKQEWASVTRKNIQRSVQRILCTIHAAQHTSAWKANKLCDGLIRDSPSCGGNKPSGNKIKNAQKERVTG
jgi:hypothetical protein